MTPINKLLSRDGVQEFWVNDNSEGDGSFSVSRTPWFGYIHVIDAAHVAKLKAALKVAVETLDKYTKDPDWREIEVTDNFCDDFCPKDCDQHSKKRKTRVRAGCQPKSLAIGALEEIERIAGGE